MSYKLIIDRYEENDMDDGCLPVRMCSHPDRAVGLSRSESCYGPVVLAGELGTEGMQKPAPDSDPSKYNDYYTYNYHIPEGLPVDLVLEKSDWQKMFKRVGKGLTFETRDGRRISPLYDIHRQRYVVYWKLMWKK